MTRFLFSRLLPSLARSALCAALFFPAAALSAPIACPNPAIRVDAPDGETADLVCESSEKALQNLAACHLPQRTPVLISVVDQVRHPLGNDCVAFADCTTQVIQVTAPDFIPRTVEDGDVFTRIPAREMFASLIAHELTHLLIHQSHPDDVNEMDHEYMAYAMQIQSLAPQSRRIFLDQTAGTDPQDTSRINAFFMSANPSLFASHVWAHFSAPGNGCDHFKRILDGEASFQNWTY